MQLKKLLAPFVAGVCALSLCACGADSEPTLPEPNDFYEVQDTVADLFNTAIDRLNAASSYKMTGSIASTAEVISSAELTSAVTPIDCTYQNGSFFIDAVEANVDPRTTYFDGERYYYTLYFLDDPISGFSTANDHMDFVAADYLIPVDSEILYNPHLTQNDDGSSDISFDIPFTVYESPAMIGHLGIVVDETHQANPMSVSASIDADGYMTKFIISFVNDTAFGDDSIHQEIVVGMTLQSYDTAVLTPPTNLDSYEDWTEDVPEVSSEGVGDHSPEDMQ